MNTANKVKQIKKKTKSICVLIITHAQLCNYGYHNCCVGDGSVFYYSVYGQKPHSFPFHWPAPWALHSICPQLNWRKIELNQTMSK